MTETEEERAAARESRKSRLEILRERQKKLRESFKSQIDLSRKTLTDEDGGAGSISPLPAARETAPTPGTPGKEVPSAAKDAAAVSVDTDVVPVTPIAEAATTPTSAQLLQIQTENEELKREVIALKADRDLLLERQMERFQSASDQLNEMELLLEDYRVIAEEAEENNAVLKAKISLLKTEAGNWKKEEGKLRDQVKQQQERLDSSVQEMNDLEKALNKAQDDLHLSDQHVMNLEHQLRSLSSNSPAAMFQHSGTTYFPPQQAVFYPIGGDGKGGGVPPSPAGRGGGGGNRTKPLVGGGGPGMPPQRRGSHNGPPPQTRRGSSSNKAKNYQNNPGPGGGVPNFGGGGLGPNFGGGGAPNFNVGAPSFNPNAPSFNAGPPIFNPLGPGFNAGPPNFNPGPPTFNPDASSFNPGAPSFVPPTQNPSSGDLSEEHGNKKKRR